MSEALYLYESLRTVVLGDGNNLRAAVEDGFHSDYKKIAYADPDAW